MRLSCLPWHTSSWQWSQLLQLMLLMLCAHQTVLAQWGWGNNFGIPQSPRNQANKPAPKSKFPKKFYLIPNGATDCYSSKDAHIKIDPIDFILVNNKDRSKVLEFPGCFDVEAVLEVGNSQLIKDLSGGGQLLGQETWDWLQRPPWLKWEDLLCRDQDDDGCNGIGNNCVYCDVCGQLENVKNKTSSESHKNLKCPNRPGKFVYKDTFCVNDWGKLDEDGDGRPDFLDDPEMDDFKDLIERMNVRGYGSMVLQFSLFSGATKPERSLFFRQKSQLRPHEWNRKHRNEWLPKFITEQRKLACVNLFFDICSEKPSYFSTPDSFGSSC